MVKATILGVIPKGIQGLGGGFAKLKAEAVNFIRAGIALRMIMMKEVAPAPEQMLVGLQGLPEYPTFRTDTDDAGKILKDGEKGNTKPPWKDMDKGLWESYMGRPDPNAPKLDIPRAKDLLKLMIQTYISNDPNFPERLEVKMISSLVEKTGLTETEARQVLNALIVRKIDEAQKADPTYDPVNKRGKTLSTIQHIAALHRIVLPADKGGTKISMGIEKNEDGDDEYVLRMEYNVASPTKRKFVLFDEKVQEIRNLIRGGFKGKIKEEADNALRVDSLEGYLTFVKELSENADLYNELIRQKKYESDANKFLYRIEELVEEVKMKLEANVEVITN
nr:2918_t:CDS:1 [Entrophospora candida]